VTVILDVPAEVGLARAHKRRGEGMADRFEAESRAFHEALRDAYLRLAAEEPDRCVAIDATEPKPAVAERIWKIVVERLDSTHVPRLPAGAVSGARTTRTARRRPRASRPSSSAMGTLKRRCWPLIAVRVSPMPG